MEGDIVRPGIVLVEPQLGENIGAAARAMGNFGLTDLIVVRPREAWPNDKAVSAASGVPDVLENARICDSVEEAVADYHRVYATTARFRDMTKPVVDPIGLARDVRDRGQREEKSAILFGGERAGLRNDDVALADAIVTIPVNPSFASLNLAQAVLLIAYEWHRAGSDGSLGRRTDFDGPARSGLQTRKSVAATRAEMQGFFEHLETELDARGFLHPPEKRPNMVRNIRNLFIRTQATEQEVRTLRGIVAALTRRAKAGG